MDFNEALNIRVQNADNIIAKYLPAEEGFQKTVFEAMNYSILAGGKRVRPILMLETYKAFGGKTQIIEPFMAAMEMIHTYSLVHDDLPCMDNDKLRRGLPTTWSKYGEDMGVLSGDSLLGFAFETALKAFEFADEIYNKAFVKALRVLANKSGCYGMLGGQVVDVELTGREMSDEQMQFVYKLKTAALIEGSMMIGGILAGADEKQIATIEKIAYSVGMAFQIKDDILDIIGDEAELGKPINSDEKNNKKTYATVHGLEASNKKVEELTQYAISSLKTFPGDTAFLEEFFKYLIYRTK